MIALITVPFQSGLAAPAGILIACFVAVVLAAVINLLAARWLAVRSRIELVNGTMYTESPANREMSFFWLVLEITPETTCT
jgi:hypothetical protein